PFICTQLALKPKLFSCSGNLRDATSIFRAFYYDLIWTVVSSLKTVLTTKKMYSLNGCRIGLACEADGLVCNDGLIMRRPHVQIIRFFAHLAQLRWRRARAN